MPGEQEERPKLAIESLIDLLMQIREQNREMLALLKQLVSRSQVK